MRWIFLRGLTREARHWGCFPETFRAAMPDAEIITLDLPGNGELRNSASPTDVRAMVDYCRAEMGRRGMDGPFGLLAMSLGAMVATDWASRHPDEIAVGVLINTSLRPLSPFYHRLKPGNYPRLLRLLLPGVSDEMRETAILQMTSNSATDRKATVGAWRRWAQQYPVTNRNALRQIIAAIRYRAPPTAPAVPMLILAGKEDRLVDCRCSKRLAQTWQADLALHPTAGHDLPLDDPDWVAATVRQWLDRKMGD